MNLPIITRNTAELLLAELGSDNLYTELASLGETNPVLLQVIASMVEKYSNNRLKNWVATDMMGIMFLLLTQLEADKLEDVYFGGKK